MDCGNAHLFKYLREGRGGTLFTEGGQYSLVNIVRGGHFRGGDKIHYDNGKSAGLFIKYFLFVYFCLYIYSFIFIDSFIFTFKT